MCRLVYANDGTSLYDNLFLNSLKQTYHMHALTFNPNPTHVPQDIQTTHLHDPIPEIGLHPFKGMRKHLLTPIRAVAFKKALNQIGADIVIGSWASTYGYYSAYSGIHPNILFVWGSDVLIYPHKYPFLQPLIRYALSKADLIVVDSQVHEDACVNLGAIRHKIIKFPWFDHTKFSRDQTRRREFRKLMGLKREHILVTSLRPNKSVYQLDTLVKAIHLLVKKHANLYFLFAGEGTETLPNLPHTWRLGRVPHHFVKPILSASDIYVSTSKSNGTSSSLLEAMCCETTPIVSGILGNREWIKDGINGLLFPVGDAETLAKDIGFLAINERLRGDMATENVAVVRAKADWKGNIAMFNNAIQDMTA